jgi:hypothetical protein
MHISNFETRFELKPGRPVFVPTDAARLRGKAICRKVLRCWKPHGAFYHLGKSGGHIAALRHHVGNLQFARRDLEHFYAAVTRTKIARSLRRIGMHHKEAFEIASESVVVVDGMKRLPYGFIQSMLLATLVLQHSELSRLLIGPLPAGVRVSIYVDDLIISAQDEATLVGVMAAIDAAADTSGFRFNAGKSDVNGPTVVAFNIELATSGVRLTNARMEQFRAMTAGGIPNVIDGIVHYVTAVNPAQVPDLNG